MYMISYYPRYPFHICSSTEAVVQGTTISLDQVKDAKVLYLCYGYNKDLKSGRTDYFAFETAKVALTGVCVCVCLLTVYSAPYLFNVTILPFAFQYLS